MLFANLLNHSKTILLVYLFLVLFVLTLIGQLSLGEPVIQPSAGDVKEKDSPPIPVDRVRRHLFKRTTLAPLSNPKSKSTTTKPGSKTTTKPTIAATSKSTKTPIPRSTAAPTTKRPQSTTPKQIQTTTPNPTITPTLKSTQTPAFSQTKAPTSEQAGRKTSKPTTATTKAPQGNVTQIKSAAKKADTTGTTISIELPASTRPRILSSQPQRATYYPRDVAAFMESHEASSQHDPRAFMTSEKSSRALVIMMNELKQMPERFRFAYLVRIFNEIGRKIAARSNFFGAEVWNLLRNDPNGLGGRPESDSIMEAIRRIFDAKEDGQIHDIEMPIDDELALTRVINSDPHNSAAWNETAMKTSRALGGLMVQLFTGSTANLIKIPNDRLGNATYLLSSSLNSGFKDFIKGIQDTAFKVAQDLLKLADRILQEAYKIFRLDRRLRDSKLGRLLEQSLGSAGSRFFSDLSPLKDDAAVVGPWKSQLFSHLGTSERVVKVLTSLLSRVLDRQKLQWAGLYMKPALVELESTLPAYVSMLGKAGNERKSEVELLKLTRSLTESESDHSNDKNRLIARCYLAGRRWRLMFMRALKLKMHRKKILAMVRDKMAELKSKRIKGADNETYRLCVPRLEAGLSGLSILGDWSGKAIEMATSGRIAIKNPIDGLHRLPDPFRSGVQMGYTIGFKVGYNEERNATLEMEQSLASGSQRRLERLVLGCYWQASTMAALKCIEMAARDGYTTTLKLSFRAGILIPAETASNFAASRCTTVATIEGSETGRAVAERYLAHKANLEESKRKDLVDLGERMGRQGGAATGKLVGAIVGKLAAEEAYRRTILRGGKIEQARFHVDAYEAGAKSGFRLGLKEGKRMASSSQLDPSAPRFLSFSLPKFDADYWSADKNIDHWEKELIKPVAEAKMEALLMAANHTVVRGTLKGSFWSVRETKKGLERLDYTNTTYKLDVVTRGFIANDIVYLTFSGTANSMGPLRGSLVAANIFNEHSNETATI